MKLATTMGIELTFSPAVLERQVQRFKSEKVFGKALSKVDDSSMCAGFATVLRHVLQHKKIAHWACSTDPSVVEVPTKPYINSAKLRSAVRRIMQEAEAIDLMPVVSYTGGGGAHIHTGVLGKDYSDRELYKARMNAYVGQNPWLAWAHLHIVDDINAEPMSREQLNYSRHQMSEASCLEQIEYIKEQLEDYIKYAHRIEQPEVYRRVYLRDAQDYRMKLMDYRKKLIRIRNKDKEMVSINELSQNTGKDYAIRFTSLGKQGTVEFRIFEMRDSHDALLKHVHLIDTIVRHVRDASFTEININTIPTRTQLDLMKYSEMKAGFHGMLRELGINVADYRREAVQMALRIRHKREAKRAALREEIERLAEQRRNDEARAARIAARAARQAEQLAQQAAQAGDQASMAA